MLASKSEKIIQNAEDVSSAMDEAVSQSGKAVTEVTNLAQSLQEGAGPQIDYALNEAQEVLDQIKKSLPEMTEKYEEFKNMLSKSNDLQGKMAQFALPLENPSQSLKSLKNKVKTFKDKISDIKNHTDNAKEKVAQTAFINNANRFVRK